MTYTRERSQLLEWPKGYPDEIRKRYRAAAEELWNSPIVPQADRDSDNVDGIFGRALRRAVQECEQARKFWPDEDLQDQQRGSDDVWLGVINACDTLLDFTDSRNPLVRDKIRRSFKQIRPPLGIELDAFLKGAQSFLGSIRQGSAEADFRSGWRSGPISMSDFSHDWRQPVPTKPVILTLALAHCFACLQTGRNSISPVSDGQCWDAAAEFAFRSIGGSSAESVKCAAEKQLNRHRNPDGLSLNYIGWTRRTFHNQPSNDT